VNNYKHLVIIQKHWESPIWIIIQKLIFKSVNCDPHLQFRCVLTRYLFLIVLVLFWASKRPKNETLRYSLVRDVEIWHISWPTYTAPAAQCTGACNTVASGNNIRYTTANGTVPCNAANANHLITSHVKCISTTFCLQHIVSGYRHSALETWMTLQSCVCTLHCIPPLQLTVSLEYWPSVCVLILMFRFHRLRKVTCWRASSKKGCSNKTESYLKLMVYKI